MSAKFPEEMPGLYETKETGNDVGDTRHWDGADANALQEELLAVAAKVGVDGDENEASLERRVRTVEERQEASSGNACLSAGMETVIANASVHPESTVMVTGTCDTFAGLGVFVSAKGEGSFTLEHDNATGNETFDYLIVN